MLFLQPAQISRGALTLLNSPKPGMNSASYSFSRSNFLSSTWADWLGPTKDTLPLSTWLSGRSRWLRRHATQFLQIVTGKPLILDSAASHQSTTARSKIRQKTRNRSLKPQSRPPAWTTRQGLGYDRWQPCIEQNRSMDRSRKSSSEEANGRAPRSNLPGRQRNHWA